MGAGATSPQSPIVWLSETGLLIHEVLTFIFLNRLPQIQAVRIIPGLALPFLPAQVQTNLCFQVPLKAATADLVLQPGLCGAFDTPEPDRGAGGAHESI